MKSVKVSVIIATKNEEDVLARLLRSLTNQSNKWIEILVVDNKSIDKTKEIATEYTDRVFDKGPERSAQRNFGAKKAQGKYLLFLDADMELTKNVIRESVKELEENKKIGAVTIPEESVATNFWEEVKAFERSFYLESGDEQIEAARFFRKDIFNEVGGYDEEITGPEDWDLPERIKRKGYLISRINSKIYHYERISSPIKMGKKKYYYALKLTRYLSKHKISAISPKTIYFLRPAFYKNWRKLIVHPILSLGMIFLLAVEQIYGGFGYLVGKYGTKS